MPIAVGFTRLHIQGAAGEEQPFQISDGIVVCNGEIFNSVALRESLDLQVAAGSSDCAVIPAMLEKGMTLAEICRSLDGDFAIAVIRNSGTIEVARDPYGVRPLYYAESLNCSTIISEVKAAPPATTFLRCIEPGTVFHINMITSVYKETRWHEVPWLKNPRSLSQLRTNLHGALEAAVAKRLTTVRDIGACLSGGLDSSLIAALAARQLRTKGIKLHTYSIGMAGSSDLEHARLVAAHIDSEHHECIVSPEECLNAIPTVIRAIESCDVTTVRASVGNYLLGRFIATVTPTVKVILNGDGADEALGGYLYMRAAPTDAAFETETTRLLTEMHRYDVARSERSMAAHGLESRSPFLDRQFIAVARGASTALLRPSEDRMEKHVLRDAFSFPHDDVLPLKVLWRRKEAFSDGISGKEKSWFEMAKAVGEQLYGTFDQSNTKYRTNPPQTAEAFWYRELYHTFFPAVSITATTPYMWMPRFIKGVTDPSARTLSAYKA